MSVDCGASDSNVDAAFGPSMTLSGHRRVIFTVMHTQALLGVRPYTPTVRLIAQVLAVDGLSKRPSRALHGSIVLRPDTTTAWDAA